MEILSTTVTKLKIFHSSMCLMISFSFFAVVVSPAGPVALKRQKKENTPQSVFTIPPELDVSLLLEFVG